MRGFLKIILALNFYLLLFTPVNAQVNLVPNPSFEQYNNCPTTTNQLYYANSWHSLDSNSSYTNNTGICNGEYFNVCANSIIGDYFGVPGFGVTQNFQYPRTGNAYIGVLFRCVNLSSLNHDRDYAQSRLAQKLILGKSYCFNMWVNVSNQSDLALDNLQVYFDNGIIDTASNCGKPISINPQIKNPTGNIIKDTLNWVLVQGSFIATGNEQYMTIGNFYTDAQTQFATINNNPQGVSEAYYLIDDVSLIPTDILAYAGRDTTICSGDSTYIGRASEVGLNDDCIWYILGNTTPIDTVAGFWAKPNVTTSYVVEQNICGTLTSDTVTVTVKPRLSLLNFNGAFATCPSDSVQIGQAALPNVTYSWSPSTGLNNTVIAQPKALPPANQIYSVTVVPTSTIYCSGNGSGTVSVNIKPTYTMSLLSNTVICLGDSIQIGNAPDANINYQWQPTTNVSQPTASQTYVHPNVNTAYSLIAMPTAASSYCTKPDTVSEQISIKPLLKGNVMLSANPKNACPNQSIQLQASVTNNSGLQWNWKPSVNLNNPTIPFPIASATTNTSYTLITTATGTSSWCGADTSTVYVHIIKLQPNVYAGRDTIVCEGKTVYIGTNATVCAWCTYNWQPTAGLQSPNASYSEVSLSTLISQTYTLSKTDSCQTTTDIVTIQTKNCTSDSIIISVPNIFTPNGDSKNDTWSMLILNGIDIFDTQTTVYNRWGEKVFESTNIHQDWDGHNIYNGKECSADTYFYIISYTNGITNKAETLKGFLELIR